MTGTMIAAVIIFNVGVVIAAAIRSTPEGKAKQARFCTKHTIQKSMVPGGPDHMVWVYGPHRTPGNECDGPDHKRASGWW